MSDTDDTQVNSATVTITGTTLTGATAVKFNGVSAAIVSDTALPRPHKVDQPSATARTF